MVETARPRADIISLQLPVPPSINKTYTAAAGRKGAVGMSAVYHFWLRGVGEEYENKINSLPVLSGLRYGVWFEFSTEMKGDIDNRIKILSDLLEVENSNKNKRFKLGLVHNDKFMSCFHVRRVGGLPKDQCRVTIVSEQFWGDYVRLFI